MTEQRKNFPDFYITAPQPCPYLADRYERKLFTHLTLDKPNVVVDNLLRDGFRRSQNIAYMPYCEECSACVSVRVLSDEFVPSKSQKRVIKRNQDLVAKRIDPVITTEQYAIFRDYIDARHEDGGMADMSVLDYRMMVEDSIIDTVITEYRMRPADADGNDAEVEAKAQDFESWPLVAVALCDHLGDGISMVYSFFDPDQRDRSLGTYMILEQISYTQKLEQPYVYLGYWIEESDKMNYKTKFVPQEHMTTEGWIRRD